MIRFKRVLIVIIALMIFWASNFVVNNLLVSAFFNEKNVNVFLYLSVISVTTVLLISFIAYRFYKYLQKIWGAVRTVEVFLFIIALTYYLIGMRNIQTAGFYNQNLMDNYQIFCASVSVYAVFIIFFIEYKASRVKAQTYNEYKAIQITQTSYYEDTRVRIPEYMSDYAQNKHGDKYIGWRAEMVSKKIYLVFFEFTIKEEVESFCFEVNLETKIVRAVSNDKNLKKQYLKNR